MSHTSENMCYTAEVFIVHEGKVLLRRHRKYGSIWLSIGGHIEAGEDPIEAALREVKEEVGLDVVIDDSGKRYDSPIEGVFRDLIPPVAIGRHRIPGGPDHVIFVYFARCASDAVVPEDPADEWCWVSKEELASMDLVPNVRAYAMGALETLS
jgi:8-oxo-dGTP diphosphatase